MKKIIFGLIATVILTVFSFGQDKNKVTVEVAKQIGNLHNKYIALGIKDTPLTNSALNMNFMKIQVDSVEDKTKNETIDFYTQNDQTKQEEIILSYLKSSSSRDLYISTKNTIINAKNFFQISKDLDLKLEEAKKLNGKEQEILFTLIETSRSSLNFWMPKISGGQGGGDSYSGTSKINWGAIGYSDGMGAVGALIRTFYMAAGGPLTWGAIVGAVGWGAAWASGTALLYQLM